MNLSTHDLQVGDDGDDEGDSWKVHTSKKLKQCMAALQEQDQESLVTWCTGLLSTEAADHMSARLQHLDSTKGSALKELVSSTGCLSQLQTHTWSLLNPWVGDDNVHSQKLKVLMDHLQHFCGDDFDQQACYDDLRGFTLSVSSAMWARMSLKFWNWPWRILRGVLVYSCQFVLSP